MNAFHAHETLKELRAERDAVVAGAVTLDGPSLAELDEMIREAEAHWVGAAVTEVASLRAQLSGPQYG